MTTQEKINLFDVRDYISMRNNNQSSNVKWKQVKSLNLPNGRTFWQMLAEIEDYDTRYEPTKTQLKIVASNLDLK